MNDCYYCGAGGATDWKVFDAVIHQAVFVCDDCHGRFVEMLEMTDSYELATERLRDEGFDE